jgi:hypothetical protein
MKRRFQNRTPTLAVELRWRLRQFPSAAHMAAHDVHDVIPAKMAA